MHPQQSIVRLCGFNNRLRLSLLAIHKIHRDIECTIRDGFLIMRMQIIAFTGIKRHHRSHVFKFVRHSPFLFSNKRPTTILDGVDAEFRKLDDQEWHIRLMPLATPQFNHGFQLIAITHGVVAGIRFALIPQHGPHRIWKTRGEHGVVQAGRLPSDEILEWAIAVGFGGHGILPNAGQVEDIVSDGQCHPFAGRHTAAGPFNDQTHADFVRAGAQHAGCDRIVPRLIHIASPTDQHTVDPRMVGIIHGAQTQ